MRYYGGILASARKELHKTGFRLLALGLVVAAARNLSKLVCQHAFRKPVKRLPREQSG
jgi:hypothetical protein